MKFPSFAAIGVSSIVMLSSQATKLSSSAATELTVVVAAEELTAVVVVATQVIAMVVAATQVAAMVVVMTQVTAVAVVTTQVTVVVVVALNPNWKIQSLPRQIQYPAYAIRRDSQHSFQVYIHHSSSP
jgi:hypothetical protein